MKDTIKTTSNKAVLFPSYQLKQKKQECAHVDNNYLVVPLQRAYRNILVGLVLEGPNFSK